MQDEPNYEEFSFSLSDFGKESHRTRNIIIGAVIVAAVIGTLFLALTAQGRVWFAGGAALISKSFADATGFHLQNGASREVAISEVVSDTSDEVSTTFDGVASNTIAGQDQFPSVLPPAPVKKTTAKKTTKKSGATKAVTPSPSISSSVQDDAIDFDALAGSESLSEFLNDGVEISPISKTPASAKNVPTKVANVIVPSQTYPVTVMIAGDGRGFVTSTPDGIACDGTGMCLWNFPAGKKMKLHASHDGASSFGGWSGACAGTTATCTVTVRGAADVTATFWAKDIPDQSASLPPPVVAPHPITVVPPVSLPVIVSTSLDTTSSVPVAPDAATSTVATTTGSLDHIVITVIQIAGTASTNDFVKLRNVTGHAVDMSGWRLRKKSGTGVDASIKVFAAGTSLAVADDFIWANSTGGFSDSIGADAASTQTLAADNSVGLFDANGILVDAVAWGTGIDQYGEGPPFSDNPAVGQLLTRRTGADGIVVDSRNNANDFIL